MLWAIVRMFDFPLPHRPLLFAFLLLNQLPAIPEEGSNYTPLRNNTAIFLALLVCAVWKRWGSDWKTSTMAILAVGLGLACSLEQAVGLICGLGAYLLMLAWQNRKKYRWSAVALFFLGSAGCISWVARGGMFVSFREWSKGALAFVATSAESQMT
jgi:hypothetical protein